MEDSSEMLSKKFMAHFFFFIPWKNGIYYLRSWAQGYKTFFILNSIEHEIYPVKIYQNTSNFNILPTVVGILMFISKINFMLSWVDQESWLVLCMGQRKGSVVKSSETLTLNQFEYRIAHM